MPNHVALPPAQSGIHNVFYLSMLRIYEQDTSLIIDSEPIALREDTTYVGKLIESLIVKSKYYVPR